MISSRLDNNDDDKHEEEEEEEEEEDEEEEEEEEEEEVEDDPPGSVSVRRKRTVCAYACVLRVGEIGWRHPMETLVLYIYAYRPAKIFIIIASTQPRVI